MGGERPTTAQRAWRFLVARFDPKSQLGLGLTITALSFVFAVWLLSGLLDAVLDNATLVRLDGIAESWFHTHATPTGLAIFNAVTQLGSPVVFVVVVVVAIYLWWTHDMLLLWNWLGANAGGKVIEYVLKSTVHRSRPQYSAPYLNGESYSFPSGHTMGSTVCYLLLAYLIASRAGATRVRRWIAFAAAGAIIVAVAFSRLYLGVHYPSDVLGGFAAGLAWLSACGATRRFIAGRRALRT
jgi:membrane-associated phospholipid phosphatase